MRLFFWSGILFISVLTAALPAFANGVSNFSVSGVIASSLPSEGIAMIVDGRTRRTIPIKVGRKVDQHTVLERVSRREIEILHKGKRYQLQVGDDLASAMSSEADRPRISGVSNVANEIAKDGNTINVSESFKEHLIKEDLSKILMQAAAVPHYEQGKLSGFQLWEIEPKSVFEVAGLKNGDVITNINGYDITNVSTTIRQLNALRQASSATFGYRRGGVNQELKIVVQ